MIFNVRIDFKFKNKRVPVAEALRLRLMFRVVHINNAAHVLLQSGKTLFVVLCTAAVPQLHRVVVTYVIMQADIVIT